MKAIKLCIAIIAAFILASCGEDIETGGTRFVAKRFVAQSEKANESVGSRTQTQGDGKGVVWSSGDKISVVSIAAPDGFKEFTLSSGAGTDDAVFDGTGFSDAEIQPYVAVYCTGTLTYSDEKVSGIVVPQTQRPVNNGFDPNAAPMTAYTTSDKVNFKHICSFIKVTIDGDLADNHVRHISFKAKNGEFVSGELENVTVGTDGIATGYNVKTGTGKKTAYLENGGSDIPAGTYYISVLPKTLDDGFEIKFETLDKVYMNRTQSGSKTTERQKIHSLGTFSSIQNGDWTEITRPEVLYGGEFSVSATKKVHFSSGNLQAVLEGPSTNKTIKKWKLALYQYDYLGNTNANKGIYSDADNDVSLFCWVANNLYEDNPIKHYGMFNVSSSNATVIKSETGSNTEKKPCDWGAAYKQSADSDFDWRVLEKDEWTYLLSTGRGQEYASSIVRVNDKLGLVIFPDNFEFSGDLASLAPVTYLGVNKKTWPSSPTIKAYSIADWSKLEKEGCMFLPAEGYVQDGSYYYEGAQGYYHCDNTPNTTSNGNVNVIRLASNGLSLSGDTRSSRNRMCVRLVTDIAE